LGRDLSVAHKGLLIKVLEYHAVKGKVLAARRRAALGHDA
jgi:uncharacterized surface protein with fasciclin (FAS1) repeats